jgi:hypothetical protein
MRRLAVVVAVCLLPAVAGAQQWTPIGRTAKDSSALFVRAGSVKRGGDTVTALILTRLASPTYDASRKDSIRAMTILATFNCKLDRVAVKETIYYASLERNRVVSRSKPKVPGYGAVFGAAFPIVSKYLCSSRS